MVVPECFYKKLCKIGASHKNDVVGKNQTTIADGSVVDALEIKLKQVKIGTLLFNNVKTIVMPGKNASFLIGQSLFQRAGSINTDYTKGMITLNQGDSLNEIRFVACSQLKLQEIEIVKTYVVVPVKLISKDTNIPPQKAIDRIHSDIVVRYFDDNNYNQAQEIAQLISNNFKGSVQIESMVRYYPNPLTDYIEIWLK